MITETYTVKPGDTLIKITKGDKKKIKKILKFNPQIKNRNEIFVGEILIVSMGKIKDIDDVRRKRKHLTHEDMEWL